MFNFDNDVQEAFDCQLTPFFSTNNFQVSSIFDDSNQEPTRNQFLNFFGNEDSPQKSEKSYSEKNREYRIQKLGIQKKGAKQVIISPKINYFEQIDQKDDEDQQFYLSAVSNITIPCLQQSQQSIESYSLNNWSLPYKQDNVNCQSLKQLAIVSQQQQTSLETKLPSKKEHTNQNEQFANQNSHFKRNQKLSQAVQQSVYDLSKEKLRSDCFKNRQNSNQKRKSLFNIQKSSKRQRRSSKQKKEFRKHSLKPILDKITQHLSEKTTSNEQNKEQNKQKKKIMLFQQQNLQQKECKKTSNLIQLRDFEVRQIIKQQNFKRKTEPVKKQPTLISKIRRSFPENKNYKQQTIKCNLPEINQSQKQKQSDIEKLHQKTNLQIKMVKKQEEIIQKLKQPQKIQKKVEKVFQRIKIKNKAQITECNNSNNSSDIQSTQIPKGIGKKYNLSGPWYKKHNLQIEPVKIRPIAPPKIRRQKRDTNFSEVSKKDQLKNRSQQTNIDCHNNVSIKKSTTGADLEPMINQGVESNKRISLKSNRFQEESKGPKDSQKDQNKFHTVNSLSQRQNSLNRILKDLGQINLTISQGKNQLNAVKKQIKQQAEIVQQLRKKTL